jgi:hypothetical protein
MLIKKITSNKKNPNLLLKIEATNIEKIKSGS